MNPIWQAYFLSILQPKQEGNVLQLAAVLSGCVLLFKVKCDDFGHPGFNAKFKTISLRGKNRCDIVMFSRG